MSEENEPNKPEVVWNRYGLTEKQWENLAAEERVIHYNRQNICEHKASLLDWPADLRDAYSRDPYFNTAHMRPCKRPQVSIDKCDCQMCLRKIGIPR